MNMVKVECVDMTFSTGEWNLDEVKNFKLINMEIIGWLLDDREDCIILAKEMHRAGGQARYLTAIPRSCVTKIIKLRR